MKGYVLKSKYISAPDLNLFQLTDSPQEVVDMILDYEHRAGPAELLTRGFA